jgi:hypothetical protein
VAKGKSIRHYVPQFVLRNFKANKKNQIHVFDKYDEKKYLAGIGNVAAEYSLYDIEVNGVTFSLEDSLTNLETNASNVIGKIISNRTVKTLSFKDRKTLAQFVATQMLRTSSNISDLLQLNHDVCEMLEQSGFKSVEKYQISREEARLLVIKSMVDHQKEFANIIMEKDLLLFEAPGDKIFFISDNPLARHNTMYRSEIRGTSGLKSKGVELYLPISPKLTLVYYCKSIHLMLIEKFASAKKLFSSEMAEPLKPMKSLIDAIEKNETLTCPIDVMDFCNSIQLLNSERRVYSSINNFSMLESMIQNNPAIKSNLRITRVS